MPRYAAISLCVLSRKYRITTIFFSRLSSISMSCCKSTLSRAVSVPSSSAVILSITSASPSSPYTGSYMDTCGREASSARAISSGVSPMYSAISCTPGSRPNAVPSSRWAAHTFAASSFKVRLTFIMPSSRRNRFISPAIIGTAYVEKRTPYELSKFFMALTRPMLPI